MTTAERIAEIRKHTPWMDSMGGYLVDCESFEWLCDELEKAHATIKQYRILVGELADIEPIDGKE